MSISRCGWRRSSEFRDHVRGRIVAARDRLFDDGRPVRALEAWLEAECGKG